MAFSAIFLIYVFFSSNCEQNSQIARPRTELLNQCALFVCMSDYILNPDLPQLLVGKLGRTTGMFLAWFYKPELFVWVYEICILTKLGFTMYWFYIILLCSGGGPGDCILESPMQIAADIDADQRVELENMIR